MTKRHSQGLFTMRRICFELNRKPVQTNVDKVRLLRCGVLRDMESLVTLTGLNKGKGLPGRQVASNLVSVDGLHGPALRFTWSSCGHVNRDANDALLACAPCFHAYRSFPRKEPHPAGKYKCNMVGRFTPPPPPPQEQRYHAETKPEPSGFIRRGPQAVLTSTGGPSPRNCVGTSTLKCEGSDILG
jgi:hypothetical protein